MPIISGEGSNAHHSQDVFMPRVPCSLFCVVIASSNVDDVRQVLDFYRSQGDPLQVFREKQQLLVPPFIIHSLLLFSCTLSLTPNLLMVDYPKLLVFDYPKLLVVDYPKLFSLSKHNNFDDLFTMSIHKFSRHDGCSMHDVAKYNLEEK